MARVKTIALLFFLGLGTGAGVYWYLHSERPHQELFSGVDANPTPAARTPSQLELSVLPRALYYIRQRYIDTDKLKPLVLLQGALDDLEQGLAPVIVHWQDKDKEFRVEVAGQSNTFQVPANLKLADLSPLLQNVARFTDENLPPADHDDLDDEKSIEHLLLNGMVSTLDPHSNFLTPKIYSEFKIGTTGNFGGIGIAIGLRDGYLSVIAPIEDTPAAAAGLKAKDRIVQIDDDRTINMSLTEAVDRLRGKVGTAVTLQVEREGVADPLTFKLKRALIKIDSVKAELLEKNVALVKIKSFQEETVREFEKTLTQLNHSSQGLRGIILDLRNNPGGLLDQAVGMGDSLLAHGTIVSTVGLNNQVFEKEDASPNRPFEDLPLIVIINEGSASASEILAGALQAHKRALVIGAPSFGKGTVQTLFELKDGSALKLTIAKYLAAGTEDVQAYGVIPDLQLIPVHIQADKVDLRPNQARREADLEKRISELTEHIVKPSPFILSYLEDVKDEEKEKDNSSASIELEHDTPVQLALRLFQSSLAKTSVEQQKALESLLPTLEAEQDQKISAALKTQNIDWSKGAEQKSATLKSALVFKSQGKILETLKAGTDIEAQLSVTNTGDKPLYRLQAVSESENPLLTDLEFPLGLLAPGQTQSYTTKLKVPAATLSQKLPLTLHFFEQGSPLKNDTQLMVAINATTLPRFSYQWSAPDLAALRKSSIPIELTLKNLSDTPIADVTINIANVEGQSGVFLEAGRAEIKTIAPGQTLPVKLKVQIKDASLTTAKLKLWVEDKINGTDFADELVLDLKQGLHEPKPSSWQYQPTIAIEQSENRLEAPSNNYALAAKVTDDQGVKEIIVFVNNDKVYYQHLSSVLEQKINATLPLKPKLNRITVLVKDTSDLVTSEQWIVWRP